MSSQKIKSLIVLHILFLICMGARAETLALPKQMTEISDEAFAGDVSIQRVLLPDTVRSIGDRAFLDCERLEQITIPESVGTIGEDFLKGCAEDVLIVSEADSIALIYALRHDVDCRCDTTYRALLIAQTYEDVPELALDGPLNDIAAVASCLELYPGTAYMTTSLRDLTAAGILKAINSVFSEAEPQDVSLLYYSGHGMTTRDDAKRGALLGEDGITCVTSDQLRAAMDRIPGRKIIIVDACYSGNLLQAKLAADVNERPNREMSDPTEFTDAFLASFKRKSRATLAGDDYFVLTSAADDELCYEDSVDGKAYGLFTSTLLKGCDYRNNDNTLDHNGNGVITLQEAYDYTHEALVYYGQHVQVYPEDCRWFGILRRE